MSRNDYSPKERSGLKREHFIGDALIIVGAFAAAFLVVAVLLWPTCPWCLH